MSTRIEIPIFVRVEEQNQQRVYVISPLLNTDHKGIGSTFDRALRSCAKDIRENFSKLETATGTIDPVLWMAMNPEITTEAFNLEVNIGGRMVQIRVMAALFEVGGYRYACLPRLDSHLVMMPAAARRPQIIHHIHEGLRRWMKRYRKEIAPDRVEIEPRNMQHGDFITTLPMSLPLSRQTFEFDRNHLSSFFASLNDTKTFKGSVELPRVATDLNHHYPDALLRALDPDPRIDRLSEAIYTTTPAPIALIGPRGSGRSTLLHEAIARQMDRAEGGFHKLQRVWHLDPTRVIAGMSIVGMWQRRLEAILARLKKRLRKAYSIRRQDALYIDNCVALCRVGRSSGSDLSMSSVLRPHIERRSLPVIIEATAEEWEKLEELDRPFADLFERIRVDPPGRTAALRMFIHRRNHIEQETDQEIHRSAIRRIVELEDRYPSVRAMPGSLIDRMNVLAERGGTVPITEETVSTTFMQRSGMQAWMLDDSKAIDPDTLRADITSRLIGQPAAADALCEVLHTVRAGLTQSGKPFASMLLIGPTGVGKTEAARVLAATMYDEPEALVRIDMNEYVDAAAASRLIGDLWRPEGLLTGKLRHRPFCVLLLDEIEKAHPSVHDLLLQALDEGRLTDSLGRTVDFSRAVILMTSNVGARQVGRSVGFDKGASAVEATYRAALSRTFRPEFLNRISQVVVFSPLGQTHIRAITRLQLSRLLSREGLQRRTTLLEIHPDAIDAIATAGFDQAMGARALKRTLERDLVTPIAALLIDAPLDVPMTINIDAPGGQLSTTVHPLHQRTPDASPTLHSRLSHLPRERVAEWLDGILADLLVQVQARAGGVISATATPDGVHIPPELELISTLREHRHSLIDLLPGEEEASLPVHAAVFRSRLLRSNPRSPQNRRRKLWKTWPTNQEVSTHEQLRIFLRDTMSEAPEYQRDDTTSAVIARCVFGILLGRAALLDRPPCVMWIRPLTPPSDGLKTLTTLLEERYHSLDRQKLDDPGLYLFDAPERFELLSPDIGIHLLYPPQGAPVAVEVRLLPLPDGPLPLEVLRTVLSELPQKQETVRLYFPPLSSQDRGSVVDLITGRTVQYHTFDAAFHAECLYHGMAGPLPLSEVPQ
ncbi:MAG: ATP-dependent Clp protease ATP-binding subunit ClpC [Myxococcota bacterium]